MTMVVEQAGLLSFLVKSTGDPVGMELEASGATAIEQWRKGCLELVEDTDASGRKLLLLGGSDPSHLRSFTGKLALRADAEVHLLLCNVSASDSAGKLVMDGTINYMVGDSSGAIETRQAPPLEAESLHYEDAEESGSMHEQDLSNAASEFSSVALREAAESLEIEVDPKTSETRLRWWQLPVSDLPKRLVGLVERMRVGEVNENHEPDGRWRYEFEESGCKRMMFLTEEERRLAVSARDRK